MGRRGRVGRRAARRQPGRDACGSRATTGVGVAATLAALPRGRAWAPAFASTARSGRRPRARTATISAGPASPARSARGRSRSCLAARIPAPPSSDCAGTPTRRSRPRSRSRRRGSRRASSSALRDRVDRDLAADVHDGRREPRRRDLRLEHRDRRGLRSPRLCGRLSRRRRALVTAAAIVLYVAFAGASPSVVRAAAMAGVVHRRARERPGGPGGVRARLGGAAPAARRPASRVATPGSSCRRSRPAGILAWAHAVRRRGSRRRRRRLPGWLTECLGGLARRPGRDAAGRPAVVRPARDRVADREPRRRAARRPGDGRVRASR